MRLAYHVMSSPVGLLFLARTERGLRYLEFMDRKSLKRMIASHAAQNPDASWEPSLLELKPYVDQLDQYFCGDRTEFSLPLDPVGSEFQVQVWRALRAIPYGETRSYGALAQAIGQPKASRAVGLANHENPIAIVVPCHRVIGASGKLVGFGGGLPRKKWLLDHEARFAQPVGRTGDLFATAPARAAAPARATAATHAKAPARTTTPARTTATAGAVAARSTAAVRSTAAARAKAPARSTALARASSRSITRTARLSARPAKKRRG